MKSLTSTSRREVPPATPYNMSLDHLLDTLPYFICAIDANGMFVFVNKTAENILGYSQDELKEKSFFDLLVETDLSKTKKMMEFIL
ncbi:MAG: PAS domain-containing protein, partial [Flavisolibacter sp.]